MVPDGINFCMSVVEIRKLISLHFASDKNVNIPLAFTKKKRTKLVRIRSVLGGGVVRAFICILVVA